MNSLEFIYNSPEDKFKSNVIYSLLINGKYYIGQTSNPLKLRISQHKRLCNAMTNRHLYNAMRKHKVIHINILHQCDPCDLNYFEKYYINKYNSFHNGYNSTSGGDNCTYSDTVKAKISESSKGKKMSNISKIKMSMAKAGKDPWNKGISGKPWSESTRESMMLIFQSDEHREKLSKSHIGQIAWNKGIPCSNEAKEKQRTSKGRGVKCIETGEIFRSISEVAERFNVTKGCIGQNCRGLTKKVLKKYSFIYLTPLVSA